MISLFVFSGCVVSTDGGTQHVVDRNLNSAESTFIPLLKIWKCLMIPVHMFVKGQWIGYTLRKGEKPNALESTTGWVRMGGEWVVLKLSGAEHWKRTAIFSESRGDTGFESISHLGSFGESFNYDIASRIIVPWIKWCSTITVRWDRRFNKRLKSKI